MLRLFPQVKAAAARAALCAVVAASPVAAQADAPECGPAAANVRRGDRAPDDLVELRACPAAGPDAFAAFWSAGTPNDSPGLEFLVGETVRARDARPYAAVMAAATTRGRPQLQRLAALRVLTGYYQPGLNPTFEYLTSTNGYVGLSIPFTPHAYGVAGRSPLPTSVRREVPELFARLAASDADPVIRGAALRLRQGIAFRDPGNTPVGPGAVTLVAGCGPRVTLRSTADVILKLDVRVLGTDFARGFALSAAEGGRPSEMLLALPAGVVTASLGGREVARLSHNGGAIVGRAVQSTYVCETA
jgi:hypothetical protein